MDWCLEKKIYDRQINKQGMADRVVDECNPDAVLSMKEITNLCFDNDEKVITLTLPQRKISSPFWFCCCFSIVKVVVHPLGLDKSSIYF